MTSMGWRWAKLVAVVALVWHPAWLGLTLGDGGVQVGFGVLAFPALFSRSPPPQLPLTRRHGALTLPALPAPHTPRVYHEPNGPADARRVRCRPPGACGARALLGPLAGRVRMRAGAGVVGSLGLGLELR